MNNEIKTKDQLANKFSSLLPKELLATGDEVEQLLLREYGAIFAAQGVTPPQALIYANAKAVDNFQAGLDKLSAVIGDHTFTLQRPAMHALQEAGRDAEISGLTIRGRAADSAARTYDETVQLWASRVEPALSYWTANGHITADSAAEIQDAEPFEQVAKVLALEKKGIFFAKDLTKSIIYSVAPPGASQHLSLLAFDVAEHNDRDVRLILYRHGWFQTVTSDLPHFTYLGVPEYRLPEFGLKRVESSGRNFWIPEI